MKKQIETKNVHRHYFRKRKRLTDKTPKALSKRAIPALDVCCLTCFFTALPVSCSNAHDCLICFPKVRKAVTFTILVWNVVPQLLACFFAPISNSSRNHLSCFSTKSNPYPHLIFPLLSHSTIIRPIQALIELAVQKQAFTKGPVAEEIRLLWNAAHQKVLFDECWLSALLSPVPSVDPHIPPPTVLWTGCQYHPLSLAFSPDGHLLASGGLDSAVQLWDPSGGEKLHTLTHPSHVWAVAWRPNGSLLAGGGKGGEICLWERQKGTDLAFVPCLSMQTTNWVSALSFNPSGTTLASTSWGDQTVKLWEVGNHGAGPRGQLLQTLPGYTDKPRCVAWSPDGRILAYSNPDKGICIFDVAEGRCRAVLHGHNTDVYGMAFTPDGTRLLSASADGTLRVWDVENYRCVRVTAGYGVCCYDLDWSPDSTHLVSGDTDGQVTLWDIAGATPPRVLYSHTWIVEGVGWSPDGRSISSSGIDGLLCLWDPTSHTLVQRFENLQIVLLSMAWSPDGSELAYGTYGQGIQVWDATTYRLRFVGQTHPNGLWSIAWSPNGMQLVGGDDDGGVYLWESRERSEQAQDKAPLSLLGHQGRVMGLVWSPDGQWLASGSGNSSTGELFLWDVERAVRVQTFEGQPGMIYALAWYPRRDGVGPRRDQLISGGSDGMLRWWDVETAECIHTQVAHQGTIRSLKVSPDGKRLASCGDDGAIIIWDLESFGQQPRQGASPTPQTSPLLRTLRRDRPYERLNITGIRGLTEAEIATLHALGATTDKLSRGLTSL